MLDEISVPKEPPFLPILASPRDRPPSRGEDYPIKRELLKNHKSLTHETRSWIDYSQYWSRVYTDDFGCETRVEISYGSKVGVIRSQMVELASKLGVSVAKVSAELSSKLQTSVTLSEEVSQTRKVTVTTPKCRGKTVAHWQRVNKCVITEETYWFGRRQKPRTSLLESKESDFFEDQFSYPREHCCPNEQRSSRLFLLDFIGARLLTYGSYLGSTRARPALPTSAGLIRQRGGAHLTDDPGRVKMETPRPAGLDVVLEGVQGTYQLGEPIPVSALDDELAELVPLQKGSKSLTRGFLHEYTGPTEHILLSPEDRGVIRLEQEVTAWLRQLDEPAVQSLLAAFPGVDAKARSELLVRLHQVDSLEQAGELSTIVGEDAVDALIKSSLSHLDEEHMSSNPKAIEPQPFIR